VETPPHSRSSLPRPRELQQEQELVMHYYTTKKSQSLHLHTIIATLSTTKDPRYTQCPSRASPAAPSVSLSVPSSLRRQSGHTQTLSVIVRFSTSPQSITHHQVSLRCPILHSSFQVTNAPPQTKHTPQTSRKWMYNLHHPTKHARARRPERTTLGPHWRVIRTTAIRGRRRRLRHQETLSLA
jgi:hypothetical protein